MILKGFLILVAKFVIQGHCGIINGGMSVKSLIIIFLIRFTDKDFTPTPDNLIETIPTFGPEFYISFNVIIRSYPSSGDGEILLFKSDSQIHNVKVKSNRDISIKSKVDGSFITTLFSGATLNTPYRIEILQTLVVDKVGNILIIQVKLF